jgi:riboflavin synthase
MFTGIVESAIISSIEVQETGWTLAVTSASVAARVKLGDSVAVDGACLSVIAIHNDTMSFFVSTESIAKTIIKYYTKGCKVNIELPLQPTSFLGGHYVLGHVDDTALVQNIVVTDTAWFVTIAFDVSFSKYVVYKGSITINGVSLTVNKTDEHLLELCIIPITLEKTNLSALQIGDRVNIEFDILAKYTEKLLSK